MAENYPAQGKTYLVKDGDRIKSLAATAYGTPESSYLIVQANPWLITRQISLENLPTIYRGDILIIPLDNLRTSGAVDLSGKDADDLTLIINGVEIKVDSANVTRTMDTAADGWTAHIPWEPGVYPDIDEALRQGRFHNASVYLGGKLMVNGIAYNMENRSEKTGQFKNAAGFSYTADIVDSTMSPPYERARITLEDRAREIITDQGISVESDITTDGIFKRVTSKSTETKFTHLASLAKQRNALISSTRQGNLLITSANVNGAPVATIEEGAPGPDGFGSNFEGRKIFNTYLALGRSPRKKTKKVGRAVDSNVPRSRMLTFTADESTPGSINQVAQWRASKTYIDAWTMLFPVASWYSNEKTRELWSENTTVFAKSQTLDFPDGYKFLIRQVDYSYSSNGTPAVLHLVPPQAYTGEPIILPWGPS